MFGDIGIKLIIFLRNCQLAFRLAESQLDIPALLDIRDMTDTQQLDRRSILTYLSQFYHKFNSKGSVWSARTHAGHQVPSHSLPPALNYSADTQDKTIASDHNIAAIKELVFNNKTPLSSSPQDLRPKQRSGSDSGLEQEHASESSSASSRLSSISPSFKTGRSHEQSCSNVTRKYPANMIIKPKRTDIAGNNRINSNQTSKSSQGKRNSNKSFQEAFVKFNSLSVASGEKDDIKMWRSQSCQTDPPVTSLVSQECQTEESHLNHLPVRGQPRLVSYPGYHHQFPSRGNNYMIMSGVYSTLV